MKRFFLFVLISSFIVNDSSAQHFHKYFQLQDLVIADSNGKIFSNALAGGLKFPVFTGIDLNKDYKLDLVILDRIDNRVLTFINTGTAKNIEFTYCPKYESLFPDTLASFIVLKDFNNDGKEDLFTMSSSMGAGITVYRNVTSQGNELKFQLESPQLGTFFFGNYNPDLYFNLPMFSVDIPCIVDFDGDGDLDIFVFDELGGAWLKLYLNISKEIYGNADSLKFSCIDEYFGDFMESDASFEVMLHKKYQWGYRRYNQNWDSIKNVISMANEGMQLLVNNIKTPVRHSGSTVYFNDIDGDGDKDILIGDIAYNAMTWLENGKKDSSYTTDKIIRQHLNFPQNNKAIKIGNMPALFMLDLDRNGTKDIIASPMDMDASDTFDALHQIWLYKNLGRDDSLNLSFVQDDFLQSDMLDFGGSTSPAFFDYDNDGDMDIVVATIGNFRQTYHKKDRLILLENTGDGDSNAFKIKNNDYLGLSSHNFSGICPAFGDVDGDGDIDLLLGRKDGRLTFYENTAGKGNVPLLEFRTDFFDSIDAGDYSAPCIYNLNNDTFPDLLLGQFQGHLKYYRNNGGTGNKRYTLIVDSFCGINYPGDYHFISPAVINYFDTLILVVGVTDFNITSGILEGKLRFFSGIKEGETPKEVFDVIWDSNYSKPINRSLGIALRPAVAKLDRDSFPDILLGSVRGGLIIYGTSPDTSTVGIREYRQRSLKVFPVPADQYLNVTSGQYNRSSVFISLFDVTGKLLRLEKAAPVEYYTLDVADLNPGIYFLRLSDEKHTLNYFAKFVKK